MVSIVISTYNRPDRLKRAIESVIGQTYKDWELIIIDDASTDATRKAVLPYCDTHPKQILYYRREKNFGTDTRPKNEGILHAKGEYVAFLDDDNEFLPDHLMALVKSAEKNPTADVIYGQRFIIFDDGSHEPILGTTSNYSPALLIEQNYIDTSDVLVKRESLMAVGGFDERYKKYVDWNLWVRMTKAGMKFVYVSKVLTRYHIHPDMKSSRVKDKPSSKTPVSSTRRPFQPEWDPFETEIILPYLGTLEEPKVAVFTLTMNRLEYTKRMYKSLKKAGYPFDWFVVDNGSTDGTKQWLASLKHVTVIDNPENVGISRASNQALDAIGQSYDFIIKVDNDCEILSDNWVAELLKIYQAHWQIILSPYVEGLVDNPGGAPRLGYKNLRGHLIGITQHIGGIFTMAHRSAYQTFRWDEDDFLHGLQDMVFTQAMQKKGYLVGYVEDLRVSHMDTTTGQQEKYPDYFKQRRYEKTHIYEKSK